MLCCLCAVFFVLLPGRTCCLCVASACLWHCYVLYFHALSQHICCVYRVFCALYTIVWMWVSIYVCVYMYVLPVCCVPCPLCALWCVVFHALSTCTSAYMYLCLQVVVFTVWCIYSQDMLIPVGCVLCSVRYCLEAFFGCIWCLFSLHLVHLWLYGMFMHYIQVYLLPYCSLGCYCLDVFIA